MMIYNCALQFEWMLYANTYIISCIPQELLVNRRMWDMKVSLIVYTKVKIHEQGTVTCLDSHCGPELSASRIYYWWS
ncbi:hypothetical protein V6Z12_D07G193300 [Gossypium hirsutum]